MKSDKQYFTTLKCTRRSALYLNEVHLNKLHDIKVNC